MAIQDYLTLSHLRKTVAAITQKINNLKPDWNAKVGEEGYIANRTHWVEVKENVQIINETITFDNSDMSYGNEESNYYESVYNQLKDAEGEKYVVVFDGQTYNGSIFYNGFSYGFGNKSVNDSTYNDTGEPFFAEVGFSSNYYFRLYIESGYTETHNIEIYISPKIYHKLDNKYINGKFVQSGTGKDSEIFNDYVNNTASNAYSHAEGYDTTASGGSSHAEGNNTEASAASSHAEGGQTTASGDYSHAEGYNTTASGDYSHAEGGSTIASGDYSHAEGGHTIASGYHSHAEGYYTTAQRRSQHVFGEYNILDSGGSSISSKGTYIEIVGKGTSNTARSNARTLDWNGNEVLAGKLTVGAAPTNNMDVATKAYVDNAVGSGSGGSGGSSTLVGLTDTSISSPTNGQVLMYNSSTGKWENTSLPIYNGGVS